MTPKELFAEAFAVYVEMVFMGDRVSPPPEGAEEAIFASCNICQSIHSVNEEIWVRFITNPRDSRPMWTLFAKADPLANHPLKRLYTLAKADALSSSQSL